MKKLKYIWLFCALLLAQWAGAATTLVSNDKNWLGGNPAFKTTEGNDFWLTFMTNNATETSDPSLHFSIYAVSDSAAQIIVEVGGNQLGTISIPEGGGIGVLNNIAPSAVYIQANESETRLNRGVHVYSSDKKIFFSCYALAQAGSGDGSTRDASMIIPTRTLGREYYVQTYPTDAKATEFAIVATEDFTNVIITPKAQTSKKSQADAPITLNNLNKGYVYLVRSDVPSEVDNIDMSGSMVCADKPVAVFQGNEATKIASGNTGAFSANHAFEQTLPATYWGKEFYLGLTANAKYNFYQVTALYDGTQVTINNGSPISLDAGQSFAAPKALMNDNNIVNTDAKVIATMPVMLNTYLSCGGVNRVSELNDQGDIVSYDWGNSTMAMVPAWEMRVKRMAFFADTIENESASGINHMYLQVIAKTAEKGTFSLIHPDGSSTTVDPTLFQAVTAQSSMSVANIELPTQGKYTLETTGSGFVGFVYTITSEARAYEYTLGYNPAPKRDSLFINNEGTPMSAASYDMDSLDGHGWYQRQWKEWVEGHERLDTAIVCDSTTVFWTIETPNERPVTTIEWNLYDVTKGARKKMTTTTFPREDTPAPTDTKHKLSNQFILPEEPMENRKQFFDYELEIILHRAQVLCGDEQLDTFRTVTRVTRIFNDTVWRVICMGDSIEFFNDSLYNQGDLSQYQAGEKKKTKFKATYTTTPNDTPWEWKVDVGAHEFQRHYLSQYGCDSLVTFELFVCDTFRFVDTIHLCSNQDTLYQNMVYKGTMYKRPGNQVDTTVIERKYKTKFCDCQVNDWKDKYKDKNGNQFKGCDSIYELHLFVYPSYDLHTTDTMDFKVQTDSVYHWIIRDGAKDSLITRDNPAMKWDTRKQAWVGYFGDTLRTKTCSECNGGNPQGCDSINSLTLIIPKVYHFYDTVKWCRIHYNWSTHDTTYTDYRWYGHHNDIVYTQSGDYVDAHTSRYGADSIYYLHLVYSQALQPVYDPIQMTVCLDTVNRHLNWTSTDGIVNTDTIRQDTVGHFYYVDESRCDSIYALELTVLPTYYIVDKIKITQEEVYRWPVNGKTYGGSKVDPTVVHFDSLITTPFTVVELNIPTTPVNGQTCDSIRRLELQMGTVYRDTVHAYACGEDNSFVWTETRPEFLIDGTPFVREVITNLPAQGQEQIYEQRFPTVLGDDSTFYLVLYRAHSYFKETTINVCQDTDNLFTWEEHETHTLYDQNGQPIAATDLPLRVAGDFYYIDSLQTDSFKCDSIWRLHLHIDPIFDKDTTVKVCQFEPYEWSPETPDSILVSETRRRINSIPTDHVGDYRYDLMFHTDAGCHFTWHLTLHVDTVYKTPVSVTNRYMCDRDTLHFYDRIVYGEKSPLKPANVPGIAIPEGETVVSVDSFYTDISSLQCDSAVQHQFIVYKSYEDTTRARICQPSEGKDSLYQWAGHNRVWDVHNGRYISADSIPTNVKGDTTYMYIDSLRTTTCSVCEQIKDGCDSLFILYLTVDSVYHFFMEKHICENERFVWQNIQFAGDSADNLDPAVDTIRKPGLYHERVAYEATNTCDSIYYLDLYVHPVYHTVLSYTYCDNDVTPEAHTYVFSDTKGYYAVEDVPFAPHPPVPESDTAITHYDPTYFTLEHTLQTVDGCDSIVTIHITVMPTYEFVQRVSICHNGVYEWRGGSYSVQRNYYDPYTTADGNCDSIFTLELFIKPVHLTVVYDTICDNETYWYRDTLRYVDPWGRDRESITEYPVWSPGDPWPAPYVETTIKSQPPDECDSLIYRYYLTICPTYIFDLDTTFCSGKPFYSEELDHTWTGTEFEYDTDVYKQPFDTVIIDSLYTLMGCDSVYRLYAHVLPSYRHIEYAQMCANDSLEWRRFMLRDLAAGDTIIRDTFFTAQYGCDSIYELQVHVHPKYFDEQHGTICENGFYDWHDGPVGGLTQGEYFFADTLPTTFYGCDSVFHLYLKVIQVTDTVIYDSICYNDTLVVLNHRYTTTGLYIDTTVNYIGCDSIIYTYLEVIPPTVPTVWAEDPMCQSEAAFDLYYTYTGHAPIAYSLYFDSVGQAMGFEDIIDVAIDEYTDPMVITVPIPYRGDDPTQYPRPNNYSIHFVLDNGICQHLERDCFHDSTFVMSYPKWITEQRFGDVIAILNANYNGGYEWDHYQWYYGDSLLVGETKEYLYIPRGLDVGAQYHVRLIRAGEAEEFPTCPITIVQNPNKNDFAPTMGYLSVVPTYVVSGHPVVSILSRKEGTFRITQAASGALVNEGVFHPDVTEVALPPVAGVYIFQLWSEQTPEEPYRNIKVIVGN